MASAVRNRWQRIDWWLLGAAFSIMTLGVLAIASTGVAASGELRSFQFLKQLIWIVIGLVLLLIFSLIDYKFLRHLALPIFLVFMLVLGVMFFFVAERNATRAWLGLNIFGIDLGIQPSEFAKIALILFLAAFFDAYKDRRQTLQLFFISLIITLIPIGLVMLQGDLGTALVFFPIYLCIAAVAGVRWQYLLYLILLGLFVVLTLVLMVWAPYSTALLWQLTRILVNLRLFSLLAAGLLLVLLLCCCAWLLADLPQFKRGVYLVSGILLALVAAQFANLVMPDYMRKRLLALLAPELYPLSSGWNVIQSIRAIGSGGVAGKGLMEGILARYGYLPTQSQSTDFLFAVLGEELGFIGCLLLFLGFMLLMWRLIYITFSAPDYFSALIAIGTAGLFFFHFLQNVGMNLGVMPVMGIPLPLFSYGGSSVMSSLAGLGIILNIAAARDH